LVLQTAGTGTACDAVGASFDAHPSYVGLSARVGRTVLGRPEQGELRRFREVPIDEDFRRIVTGASGQWQPADGGDPNTIDLMWIALSVDKELGTPLPQQLPAKQLGVALIDQCIEGRFVTGLIRDLSPTEIATRSWELVECARSKGFVHPPVPALAALLLMWTGCIGMAKSLRVETSGGERYTEEMRRAS
jgi:hypothetical protein